MLLASKPKWEKRREFEFNLLYVLDIVHSYVLLLFFVCRARLFIAMPRQNVVVLKDWDMVFFYVFFPF